MAASVDLPSNCVTTLTAHEGPVLFVTFNGNGEYCISTGKDRTLKLWNPHQGHLIATYTGHGYEVLGAHASADHAKIASCGGDKAVYMWDVATKKAIRRFHGHEARVNCVQFNADGTVVVSGSYDKTVCCHDVRANNRNGKPIQVIDHAHDSVESLIVTPTEIITGSIDGHVRTYDIRVGHLVTDNLHKGVTSVALSGDDNCVLASCLDSRLRLIDRSSGDLLNEYRGHRNRSYKVASVFSGDDAYVLSGSEDGCIYAWDLVEASWVRTLRGHKGVVGGLAYHPSACCLISGGTDGTVKVWK